ncbi:MAG: aldo/keto reductase [Candidatus Thermoplasmatota archaeon]|nr:aldo/keto reductase [Candidatus Thermoplasmatota archaeon]
MKYVRIGKTGLYSSIFALGTMTFGARNSWKLAGVTQQEADRMVRKAFDAGINLFDTADVYEDGDSETILGNSIRDFRDQVIIATKVRGRLGDGINDVGLTKSHMYISARKSIERMKCGWIDLYQFHGWDSHVPIEETMDGMEHLIEEGLVIYPGVSNFAAWQMAYLQGMAIERGYSRYQTAQMNYSLLNRDIEHEVLPFIRHSQMSLLVWSPLHGGVLSGKYDKDLNPRSGTRAGDRGFFFPPFDREVASHLLPAMEDISREIDASLSQIALSWLIQRKHIVILGVRNMKQLEDNLGALDVNLNSEHISRLDEITALKPIYPGWMIERQSRGRDFQTVE